MWNLFTPQLQQESITPSCDTRSDQVLQIQAADELYIFPSHLSTMTFPLKICVKEKSCNKRKQCAFNTWLPVVHHPATASGGIKPLSPPGLIHQGWRQVLHTVGLCLWPHSREKSWTDENTAPDAAHSVPTQRLMSHSFHLKLLRQKHTTTGTLHCF